ncbi:MAG TPA: GAP family protein [Arthrobacter sp.]|nr:GAP family protein [Arthrobacter sp.]
MLELVSELVPQAVGMAASPLPLIAVLVMILSPNGRNRSIGFAVGRVLAVLATVLAVAGLSEFATQGAGGTRVSAAVRPVLGVVLVLLALPKLRSRPQDAAEREAPGWIRALDGMSPARALSTGFLVTAVNPKELIFPIAADVAIWQRHAPVRHGWRSPDHVYGNRHDHRRGARGGISDHRCPGALAIIGAVMIGKGLASF